jgi:hypothetical protein
MTDHEFLRQVNREATETWNLPPGNKDKVIETRPVYADRPPLNANRTLSHIEITYADGTIEIRRNTE